MLAHVFTFLRKHNTAGELNFAAFALFIGLSEDALGNLYYFARNFISPNVGELSKPVTGLVVALCLLSLVVNNKRVFGIFQKFMAAGLVLGLINTLFFADSISPSAFFSHLTHWTLMFICFSAAYSSTWSFNALAKFFAPLVFIIIIINGGAIALLEYTRIITGETVYVGSSAEELLIPFAWFAAFPSYFFASLPIFLALVSGKRGPLLAILSMTLMNLMFFRFKQKLLVAILKLSTLIFIPITLGLVLSLNQQYSQLTFLPDFIERPLHKYLFSFWYLANSTTGLEHRLDIVTSGRAAEIIAAWNHLKQNTLTIIFGSGFGWELDIFVYDDYRSDKQAYLRYHYLHFSPLNTIVIYGFCYALIFYGLIVTILSNCWNHLIQIRKVRTLNKVEQLEFFLILLIIGKLVVSITAYNIGVDPVFWIILGILAQKHQNYVSKN